jgi:hypothetical protein
MCAMNGVLVASTECLATHFQETSTAEGNIHRTHRHSIHNQVLLIRMKYLLTKVATIGSARELIAKS